MVLAKQFGNKTSNVKITRGVASGGEGVVGGVIAPIIHEFVGKSSVCLQTLSLSVKSNIRR